MQLWSGERGLAAYAADACGTWVESPYRTGLGKTTSGIRWWNIDHGDLAM